MGRIFFFPRVALAASSCFFFLCVCCQGGSGGGRGSGGAVPEVPAVPGFFQGETVSAGEVWFTWQDNSDNEDGFRIERNLQPTSVWEEFVSVGPDVCFVQKDGRPPGRYNYRLYAYNAHGKSAFPPIVQLITPVICGDTFCTKPAESLGSCPVDCAVCRDGLCTSPPESAVSCYEDCGRCRDGLCTSPPETMASCPEDCAVCGDGLCTSPPESAVSCYEDCGRCGDGLCTTPPEEPASCYPDCGSCGDGQCTSPEETPVSCYKDCGWCGDDLCTVPLENLDSCPVDCALCGDGLCTTPPENLASCPPDCAVCGDELCTAGEEDALNCPPDCSDCGDGLCSQPAETATSCYEDCGRCGDGECTSPPENAASCYGDCGFCGDGHCSAPPEDVDSCYSDCGFCGDDLCTTGEESVDSCYADCGWCGDRFCTVPWEDTDSCPEDCPGRWCKVGEESRITSTPAESVEPSLVWAGSEFGLSWHDSRDGNREVYFARVSATGARIGEEKRITNAAGASWYPSLVWTGTEFGLSWSDYRDGNYEIYFARLTAAGVKIGQELRLTADAASSGYPSLVFTASEFGVSWSDLRDSNAEIYFARLSAAGTKIGGDLRLTTALQASVFPSLVFTGSEFGVSWTDFRPGNNEIYFARLSSAGVKIGDDVRITNSPQDSESSSLAWTGSEFAVGWSDLRDGNREIYLARLSSTGVKIGQDMRITHVLGDSRYPSLVFSRRWLGLSWQDSREGNREIYFVSLALDGTALGEELRITWDSADSSSPSLAFTGREFGVSWADTREGSWEVYFVGLRRE